MYFPEGFLETENKHQEKAIFYGYLSSRHKHPSVSVIMSHCQRKYKGRFFFFQVNFKSLHGCIKKDEFTLVYNQIARFEILSD